MNRGSQRFQVGQSLERQMRLAEFSVGVVELKNKMNVTEHVLMLFEVTFGELVGKNSNA
jgi:hypothetical protein